MELFFDKFSLFNETSFDFLLKEKLCPSSLFIMISFFESLFLYIFSKLSDLLFILFISFIFKLSFISLFILFILFSSLFSLSVILILFCSFISILSFSLFVFVWISFSFVSEKIGLINSFFEVVLLLYVVLILLLLFKSLISKGLVFSLDKLLSSPPHNLFYVYKNIYITII